MENFAAWARIALDLAVIALGAYGLHLLRRERTEGGREHERDDGLAAGGQRGAEHDGDRDDLDGHEKVKGGKGNDE